MKIFNITTHGIEADAIIQVFENPFKSLDIKNVVREGKIVTIYFKQSDPSKEIKPEHIFQAGVLAERFQKRLISNK